MTDSFTYLREPVTEGGVASPRFFNGRLLSGEALTQLQDAEEAHHRQLGLGLGAGIVSGLSVSVETAGSAPPVLRVSRGLAIARSGDALQLPNDVSLSLGARPASESTTARGGFGDCAITALPGGAAVIPGVFMLVMGAASEARGRAPVSGLSTTDVCCNVRDDVEGVSFRVAAVVAPAGVTVNAARRRSEVAALCFGLPLALSGSAVADPVLTGLVPACLAADEALASNEMPIAVFYLASGRVQWVDNWAVRRRVTQAFPGDAELDVVGDAHRIMAEAMLLQLRDQLPSESALRMAFTWLPPVGVITLSGETDERWRDLLGDAAPAAAQRVSVDTLSTILRQGLDRAPLRVNATNPAPAEVYVSGTRAVFVRSTKARVRVLVRDRSTYGTVYAKARDPNHPARTMRYQGYNAFERVVGSGGGAYTEYTLDLEPGFYKLYAYGTARSLGSSYEAPRYVVGGATDLIDLR